MRDLKSVRLFAIEFEDGVRQVLAKVNQVTSDDIGGDSNVGKRQGRYLANTLCEIDSRKTIIGNTKRLQQGCIIFDLFTDRTTREGKSFNLVRLQRLQELALGIQFVKNVSCCI